MAVDKPEPMPVRRSATQAEVTYGVMRDLIARDNMGRRKYGGPLVTFDGRCTPMDTYQEALDLVQYWRKHLDECKAIALILSAHLEEIAPVFCEEELELLTLWLEAYEHG